MIEVDCRKCKNCNSNKCIVYNTDNADVAVKNVPTITLQIISRRKMMAKTICKGAKIGEVPDVENLVSNGTRMGNYSIIAMVGKQYNGRIIGSM